MRVGARMDVKTMVRWAALLSGCLLFPAVAAAGSWRHSASLAVSGEYDSNVHLVANDEESAWIGVVRPSYGLSWSDGRDSLELGGNVLFERSTESVASDRNDPSVFLGWRRANPRGSVGLRVGYAKTSLRWFERAEPEEPQEEGPGVPDEPEAPVDDPRLYGRRGSREVGSVSLAWSHALAPRWTLGVDAGVRAVEQNSGNLPDYGEQNDAVSLAYELDPRSSVFTRASWIRNDPDNRDDYYSTSAVLGVSRRLSDNFNVSFDIGGNHRSPDGDGIHWQGGGAFGYRAQRLEVSGSLRRAITASAYGGFVETDSARLGLGYALDDRTRLASHVNCRRARAAADSVLCGAGASVSRRLAPSWTGGLSYYYRLRDDEHAPTVHGHIVRLTVSYSWSSN